MVGPPWFLDHSMWDGILLFSSSECGHRKDSPRTPSSIPQCLEEKGKAARKAHTARVRKVLNLVIQMQRLDDERRVRWPSPSKKFSFIVVWNRRAWFSQVPSKCRTPRNDCVVPSSKNWAVAAFRSKRRAYVTNSIVLRPGFPSSVLRASKITDEWVTLEERHRVLAASHVDLKRERADIKARLDLVEQAASKDLPEHSWQTAGSADPMDAVFLQFQDKLNSLFPDLDRGQAEALTTALGSAYRTANHIQSTKLSGREARAKRVNSRASGWGWRYQDLDFFSGQMIVLKVVLRQARQGPLQGLKVTTKSTVIWTSKAFSILLLLVWEVQVPRLSLRKVTGNNSSWEIPSSGGKSASGTIVTTMATKATMMTSTTTPWIRMMIGLLTAVMLCTAAIISGQGVLSVHKFQQQGHSIEEP